MLNPTVMLQINLAPSDCAHAGNLFADPYRTRHGRVDEALPPVARHRRAGRFSARWSGGGPVRSCFFAVDAAAHDHVLHTVSDMFCGTTAGRAGSRTP